MIPQWVKNSRIYPSLRRTASALEEGFLRAEYSLLTPSGRRAELLEQIRALPRSNGSRFYTRLPYRVGMVADCFLFENYSCSCDLVYLTPENWRSHLGSLDCVIVTSVWKGLHGEWTGASDPGSSISAQLCALMQETRAWGCPVIFYSKEDPPNFQWFQRYAPYADRIYTSAQECIEKYRTICPGVGVETMQFAISPLLHHPIGMKGLTEANRAFFAGSWMKKYPERVSQQRRLFDWVRQAGLQLDIADRNYSRYRFQYNYPLRYLSCVLPEFTYEEVSSLYKLYDWVLNLNSVHNSRDMFSLRVYDALACGSLVLSNQSVGMEAYFPQVYVIDGYETLQEVLDTPLPALEQRRLDGIRQVFRTGTVYEKMEHMLRSVGLSGTCCTNELVGVIPAEDIPDKALYREMFDAQTYEKKVWIDSPGALEEIGRCGMVALWGKDRWYGKFYLEDLVNGFKYTDCDYVTKPDISGGPKEIHRYTTRLSDPYATLFWRDAYFRFWKEPRDREVLNGYLSDGQNYGIRTAPDPQQSNLGVVI